MTELTPENVRAAAEIAGLVRHEMQYPNINESDMRCYADRLEREQAVEAKRAELIEELALLMFRSDYPNLVDYSLDERSGYYRYAQAVVDAHPSLLDEPKDGGR